MTTAEGFREWDELQSVSVCPGYRDIGLNIRLHTGEDIQINLRPHAVASLQREIAAILHLAGSNPLDKEDAV